MAIPYKKRCTVCNIEFLTFQRGQNVCSKKCRNKLHKTKFEPPKKCDVCNWSATIEEHHENGCIYYFCPNHHSLITRGKQTLEEVLKGVEYKSHPDKIQVPLTRTSLLLHEIRKANIIEFQYADITKLMGWEYGLVRKYIQKLVKFNKVIPIGEGHGDIFLDEEAKFKML
jgi:hypothetical protein